MTDIILTKKSGDDTDCSLQTKTFLFSAGNVVWAQTFLFRPADYITITNFCSLDFDIKSPVQGMPIPELRDTCNILVKAEGNTLGIAISFTMKEETTSIFTGGGGHAAQSILTVQQQLDFWLNTFQPNSIEDAYSITVDGIERVGIVRGITFNKSAQTPVTYNVRIDFLAGNVVAGES
jgi:hypothetical protein